MDDVQAMERVAVRVLRPETREQIRVRGRMEVVEVWCQKERVDR